MTKEAPIWNPEIFPAGIKVISPDGGERIVRIHKSSIPDLAESEDSKAEANIKVLREQDVNPLFEMIKPEVLETVVFEASPRNGKTSTPTAKELQPVLAK